jgi:Flp pilus assembly protein TadD
LTDTRQAAASDPVSVDPLFLLSAIDAGTGNPAAARNELVKAVSLQPANPSTWEQLGCYDLGRHHTSLGSSELRRAYVLVPGDWELFQLRYQVPFCARMAG